MTDAGCRKKAVYGMNKIHKTRFLHSNKGVTLVELLVSIAILSVVAMPFLASFLTSTSNNVKSERILVASNIAHRAMEEIKADPSRLTDMPDWTVFTSTTSEVPWTIDPDIDGYTIEYKIDEIIINHSMSNFALPADSDYEICFYAGSDSVTLSSTNYPLSSGGGAISYTLSVLKNGALYAYSFNGEADVSFVPSSGSIDIGIMFIGPESTGENFVIDIAADEEIELPINIYIVDDIFYKLVLSASGNDFNIFRSKSVDQAVSELASRIYSIGVRVKHKDEGILNTIASMIKK
ncbi:MAG TPA: type II secretion system protein [Clostridiaceae bacterium]|jgi:prepilin-type N-terminal cleavage/methylation domain-containing protein|nr:type II secretion system protein [Clostridiaceae bacterium]